MTRAALLHLFDSPEALPTAVQDLEQLALAFPYCQTAHLLLAKAAHDQGSMLAGQRLRRAATYAADRHLLRLLLETPVRRPAAEALPALVPSQELEAHEVTKKDENKNGVDAPAPALENAAPAIVETATEQLAAAVSATAVATATATTELTSAPQPEPVSAAEEPVSAAPEQVDLVAPVVSAAPEPIEPAAEPLVLSFQDAAATAAPVLEDIETGSGEVEPAALESPAAETSVAAPEPAVEPEAAPLPIRPSAEAGTARYEFGLNADLETGFSAYQLPELLAEEPAMKAPSRPAADTATAFLGSADLAYALGAGSRFGYALLAPPDATATGQPLAETPGTVLPPAGEFFAPDALVLEHLASQPPPAPPAPSPFDLIDSFLRRAPQRRRGIVTLLTVSEQADLSMRSTQAESGLASESLARILAGQGKIDRAITVYERLMVRQPEKSAYFAVQIELLRNPPTPSS